MARSELPARQPLRHAFRFAMASLLLAVMALWVNAPALAEEMYHSIGVGGGPENAWNWQTLTWTPFNAAGETGLIVLGSLKAEAKTYVTDILARDDSRIWVSGIGLGGKMGWQVAGDWGQAAVLAGVAWRDYTLSPNDPNSKLGPNQLHGRVSAQGQLVGSENWGAGLLVCRLHFRGERVVSRSPALLTA